MFFISTPMKTYTLGNNIFYAKDCNRHILCNTEQQAVEILHTIGLSSKSIVQVERLNEGSIVLHRLGERMMVRCGSKMYDVDTMLALGSPSHIDTTKPLSIIWRVS